MRSTILSLSISIIIFMFSGCGKKKSASENNPNILFYEPVQLRSGTLTGQAQLKGLKDKQEIILDLSLSNQANESITIQSIEISTEQGYKARLISNGSVFFQIAAGQDTLISLKFKPVNDIKLFKITGRSGSLKSKYNLSINFNEGNNEKVYVLNSIQSAQKKAFIAYQQENHTNSVVAYFFDPSANYLQQQKKYLTNQHLAENTPFIHLNEQEVAIAGLNFRLEAYEKKDTLFAELHIVNHALFPIKINPRKFDIIRSGSSALPVTESVRLAKISGSQREPEMLRRGDRAVLTIKKVQSSLTGNQIEILLKNTFILPNGHSLFYKNLNLAQLRI